MKVPTEDVIIDEDDTSPPRKKLKQARLPFQVLSPSVVESPPDVKYNKKRKVSEGSLDDLKLLKVVKTNEIVETKENLCTPVCIDPEQEAKQLKQVEDELAVKVTNSNCIDTEQKQGICADVQERKHISPKSRNEDQDVIVLRGSDDDEVQLEKETVKPTIRQNKTKKITPIKKSTPIGKVKVRNNKTSKNVLKVIKKENTVQVKVSTNKKTSTSLQKVIKKTIGTEKKNGSNNSTTSQTRKTLDATVGTKEIKKQNIFNKNNFSGKGQAKVSKPKIRKPGAASKTEQKLEQNEGNEQNIVGEHLIASKKEVNHDDALEPKTKQEQCLLDEQSSVSKRTKEEEEGVSITPSKADMTDSTTPKKVRSDNENLGSASDVESPNDSNSSELQVGVITPKQNSPNVDITPTSRKRTRKPVQKQLDSAKKKEEKERQKQEKEKKKAEEKEEKQRNKLEKEEQKKKEKEEKEQKKKEREEKDEQRKKEKEEKEKKRLAELEMKTEEKKVKDEEKRKKEEQRLLEKRKRDEKKQAEEDAKRKEAAVFTSFFRTPKYGCKPEEVKIKTENFMPFEVKADMRLAPLVRTWFDRNRRNILDQVLAKQEEHQLYLKQLTQENITLGNCGKTWPLSEFRDEVVILDDDDMAGGAGDNLVVESHSDVSLPRPKLLQFWENQRPPYWGTWRKKSSFIKPTEPFGKDEKLFDYEVDSDEEWEEEEPGESLHGSDDEKESEDEYEVDNEFFVPHGYLSDEENECEEDEALSPETLKAKLKLLELEFEEEMKHKTERIKPRVIGCIWTNTNTDPVGAQLLKLLSSRRAVFRDGPIVISTPDSVLTTGSPSHETPADKGRGRKKRRFPDDATPSLIKLVHGNINGRGFLVKEFFTYWRKQESLQNSSNGEVNAETNGDITVPVTVNTTGISKKSIANKIKEIASYVACPDEGPMMGRNCWYVSSDLRSCFGLEDLTIPNKEWNYNLTPKKREIELVTSDPSTSVDSSPKSKKKLPLITKFTKRMSRKELQKQFELTGSPVIEITEVKQDVTNSSSQLSGNVKSKLNFFKPSSSMVSSQAKKQHKRVPILMSVAVGQNIPKSHNMKPNVSGLSLDIRKSESKPSTKSSSPRTNTTTGIDNETNAKSTSMVIDDSDCIVLSD